MAEEKTTSSDVKSEGSVTDDPESILLPEEAILQMRANHNPLILTYQRGELKEWAEGMARSRGDFFYRDVNGTSVNNQLRFRCRVDFWNRLRINNTAFSAKGLAYYFSGIQWAAGRGWPTYSTRCPRSDTGWGLFPNSKRHMLIVQFGGYAWDECENSSAHVGNQITDIFVGANDDQFPDNTGGFEFVVTSYSQ